MTLFDEVLFQVPVGVPVLVLPSGLVRSQKRTEKVGSRLWKEGMMSNHNKAERHEKDKGGKIDNERKSQ